MVAFKSHSDRVKNQFQQIIKITMVEMDKQSNNQVKLNNQEYSSVLLLLRPQQEKHILKFTMEPILNFLPPVHNKQHSM